MAADLPKHAVEAPVSVSEMGAVQALLPTQSDVRSAFGSAVTDHADGTYTVNVEGREGLGKLREMRQRWARAAGDAGAKMSAAVETVAVRTPQGETRRLPSRMEAELGARGFHAVVTGRRSLCERFDNGLLYTSRDGGSTWHPLGMCVLGKPLRPCRNKDCSKCGGGH